MLGLATLRGWAAGGANSAESLLMNIAKREQVLDRWYRQSARNRSILVVLWLSSACTRGLGAYLQEAEWSLQAQLALVSHMVSSALFLGRVYSVVHLCCPLGYVVDSYCGKVVHEDDIATNVHSWNLVQAVLRKTSGEIQAAFLILQTTAMMYMLTCLTGLHTKGLGVHWLAVASLLVVSNAKLLYVAAQVTEKCTRVPPLINSLSFSNGNLDYGRQYLVEYVTYSNAGFYVGEVRLTAAMTLKLSYVCGIAAFGILTKLTTGI